jgi:Cu(I)/Ag(I) efflux system membrane fusion protein
MEHNPKLSKPTSWLLGIWNRHWGKILLLEAVGLLGLGYLLATPLRDKHEPQTATAVDAKAETQADKPKTVWTCSMHPQIRQQGPGLCPLCQMALVEVPAGGGGGGLRRLTVSPAARALMNLQTAPVEKKYVSHEVRMVGKVDYDETRLKYITAWVPGRLDRLYVDYTGAKVTRGDHLVYLYSEEVYAAQEELIQALRYNRLRGNQSATTNQPRINLAESAREKLRLWGLTDQQIQQIESQQTPTDHITIYSPISGVVIEKLRQEGDRVALGDRIYTVADLSQVWVHLDAYESDLTWLRYGQEVAFTTEAYPGETFVGRIAFIQPVLDDKTRTVKVRVNMPNPDGRLKPEMFGNGIVHVRVGVGGRVVEPDLAGKWISPMHPEIIKDGPGTCDICGMPLVPVESLGYLTTPERELAKPLVIPVSAALVTGRRAIVYVEVPDAETPTFEGREIVLGPKAGDYYVVRSGLGEGELVVSHGNFKLDSEIQLQARPSMMTPDGGIVAGAGKGLPTKFVKQMRALIALHTAIADAMEDNDWSRAGGLYQQLGEVLVQVDASTLSGDAINVWSDMSMLFTNDVVEGRDLNQPQEGQRVYELLTNHVHRLRIVFGLQEKNAEWKRVRVPPEFQAQLAKLYQVYLKLQTALAADDFDHVQQNLVDLQTAAAAIEDAPIPAQQARKAWEKEKGKLAQLLEHAHHLTDIEAVREMFSPLSNEMGTLIRLFGLGDVGPMYQFHCSMALAGEGAIWFQNHEETKNPYFGAAMLGCADEVEKISPKAEQTATEGPNAR